jgi:hypothetical protein
MTGTINTVTRPNEFSQFSIKITNKKTGQTLLEDGFGNLYGTSQTSKQFVIRENGPYVVTLYGQKITVDLEIRSTPPAYTASPVVTAAAARIPTVQITPTRVPTVTSSPAGRQKTESFFTTLFPGGLVIFIIFVIVLVSIIAIIAKKGSADPQNWYIPPVTAECLPGHAHPAGEAGQRNILAMYEHRNDIPWLVDMLRTADSHDRNHLEEMLVEKGADCVDALMKALPSGEEVPELRELIFRILARIGNRQAEAVFLRGLVDQDQAIRFWAHFGIRKSVLGG